MGGQQHSTPVSKGAGQLWGGGEGEGDGSGMRK